MKTESEKRFDIAAFGAVSGGEVLCTDAIQAAIDAAGACGGEVSVPAGVYLTGALFLKSGVCLRLEKDAVLLGVMCEDAYPLRLSRVAGVEMDWPAAVLNVIDAAHVKICGEGTIDGQGEYWWKKYWGEDRRGGMRAPYEKQGLRWAVDYDCFRVRNVVVFNSSDVELEGFTSRRSGFWNIHLCYSSRVAVRGVVVKDNAGPSTDGIDIDSCSHVLVEHCCVDCNDDNICVKAGRDWDGLRVNRPSEDIVIQDCTILRGGGIALGSETSGGIRRISIRNNMFLGTGSGLRMKSARTRGGTVSDITVEGMTMTDVRCPFSFEFDWNPMYSYCEIPGDYTGLVPEYWGRLTRKVERERGIPHTDNIRIRHVTAVLSQNLMGESTAFQILGLREAPFQGLVFEDVKIQARDFGKISRVRDLVFRDVEVNLDRYR